MLLGRHQTPTSAHVVSVRNVAELFTSLMLCTMVSPTVCGFHFTMLKLVLNGLMLFSFSGVDVVVGLKRILVWF